ncbi:MAG TPA: amidohydrolase family protein [Baekduia sp.]|nr:amidohydrolase family protein [Baekduia sp.]
MARAEATDIHQHMWPEGFVRALATRTTAPFVRTGVRGWTMRIPGEPDYEFSATIHDPGLRARALRNSGLDRALLANSSPLGVEALPEDEARPLLEAWHDGVFEIAADRDEAAFGVWGALPIHGGEPADVDVLIDRGAVGISLAAGALASPAQLDALGPVLRRLEVHDAPLFVHPGPAQPATHSGGPAPWWPALTDYVADMQAAWMTFAGWGRREHPALRICFAMLAGGAPFQIERLIARGGPATAVRDSRLFYDTSSYGPKAIAAAASIVGPDQLVHGSDRPLVDGNPSTALGRQAAAAMTRENVARLLKGI